MCPDHCDCVLTTPLNSNLSSSSLWCPFRKPRSEHILLLTKTFDCSLLPTNLSSVFSLPSGLRTPFIYLYIFGLAHSPIYKLTSSSPPVSSVLGGRTSWSPYSSGLSSPRTVCHHLHYPSLCLFTISPNTYPTSSFRTQPKYYHFLPPSDLWMEVNYVFWLSIAFYLYTSLFTFCLVQIQVCIFK